MLSNRLIHTSAAFFVVDVALSVHMAWYGQGSPSSLQIHFLLLGWTSLSIMGLLYSIYPHLQRGRLPNAHYWLHTLGLLLLTVGGMTGTALDPSPMTAVGGGMLALGAPLFSYHVLSQLRTFHYH